LFDFINVYSETFVFGGDEGMPQESAATKAWLNEALPPMTVDSGNDVCFMKDGTLCVLYVLDSFNNFDEKVYNELMHLKENFTNAVTRGIRFTFAKLDASAEPEFAGVFGIEQYPQIVILNAGKRKRFIIHEGEITSANLQKGLETILDGDGKFKKIAGNTLPSLVSRHESMAEK
jgi:hypothetical protein